MGDSLLKEVNPRVQFRWRYKKAHCRQCTRNIWALIKRGIVCWRKLNGQGHAIYWCDRCKQELFEGVKLR